MNADPEFNTAILRDACVALDHRVLHLDGAAHRVYDAAEFDERPIAGALDDATVMNGDRRVDEIASQRPQASQGTILVCAGQPAEANHIGGKDRDELSFFGHWSLGRRAA